MGLVKFISVAVFVMILAVSGSLAAERPKVPAVWKKVYEKGILEVIIDLDMRFSLDTKAAVTNLERELVGTQYRLRRVGRGWTSMEVGVGALQVLDASSLVVTVSENIQFSTQ